MENRLISVIVPIYNCEKYLEKCINSILSQTYDNIELLLIDDGSIDGSSKICKELINKNKDKKIMYYHQKNNGQAAARNFGIKQSTGDYIAFVDADDWIAPQMYEILLRNIMKSNAKISCCGIERVKDGKHDSYYNDQVDYFKVMSSVESIKMLLDNKIITCSPCDKLFTADIVKNRLMNEHMIFEDFEVMPHWLHSAKTIVYSGMPLYHYRYNPKSTIQNISIRRLDEVKASELRTRFIINNYPELTNLAKQKDLEVCINVLGYTSVCSDSNKKRYDLKKIIIEKSYEIKNKNLSVSYKLRLFLIKIGLPVFDLVYKIMH